MELIRDTEYLEEKLITFGGVAYPKFDNVVIMAGGGGSGKGFTLSKLMGIEGKVLDVDELKTLAMKTSEFRDRVKQEMGIDITKGTFDLKKPENTSKLHEIIDKYHIMDKKKEALFTSIVTKKEMKPNIIFDVTLKNLSKLHNLAMKCEELGYKKENIHIVWVINDYEVALAQNFKRDRVVPEVILKDTHTGASQTMRAVITMGNEIKQYVDGDIWFAFNQSKIDVTAETREYASKGRFNVGQPAPEGSKVKTRPVHIKEALYMKVKPKGGSMMSITDFSIEILEKIKSYVPHVEGW